MNIMNRGTVKFFNEAKGYGFIIDDDTKKEIFVHASGVNGKIKEGDKVTFKTEKGKKGESAVDVDRA